MRMMITHFFLVLLVPFALSPRVMAQGTVGYPADTLPDANSPPFSINAVGGFASIGAGVLTINDDTASNYRFYQRNDALISSDSAVMRVRLQIDSSTPGPGVAAGFYDGSKNAQVYFDGTTVGFAIAGAFLSTPGCPGTAPTTTTDGFHEYELRKLSNTEVQVFRDGSLIIDIPYSCLGPGGAAREGFGTGSDTGMSISRWDYVVYRIGTTTIESTPPDVVTDSPAPGQAVGTIHALTAQFSESMNATTINNTTFKVSGSVHGPISPASVQYDDASETATFNLVRALAGDNETYTITLVGTGASPLVDLSLNTLDGEFTGAFPSGDGTPGGDFVSTFVVNSPEPTTFFGEDVNTTDPCPNGTDTPFRPVTIPASQAANDQFVASLTGVQTEAFERYAPESIPTTLQFGSVNATLSGFVTVKSIPAGTLDGVYPTSGDQCLFQFGGPGTFQIAFDSPQKAFGFFATDVGDGGGQLILQFVSADGFTQTYTVPNTTSQPFDCPNTSGSALFYGVVDPGSPFVRVVFTNTNSTFDGFGFDDMSIGSVGQCSPLPGAATSLLVQKSNGGADLQFTWVDASDADDQVMFSDQNPAGRFDEVVGTSPSGGSGLTIAMPSSTRYYLVAGSNSTCGAGEKH